MKNPIESLLSENGYVLLDGAMGTMLFGLGLTAGAPPEEWNVLFPERVKSVHLQYINAGSNIILTNSFGGTRFRLKLHGLDNRVYELNRAAAHVAKEAAAEAVNRVFVGGSMGPTGELLEPMGSMTFDDARLAFAEQAKGLADGGADLLWIETMSDLNEVIAAVEGARITTTLPIAATMTFDTNGRTMMGVTPELAMTTLEKYNLVAIGGNCGNGPQEIEGVIAKMSAVNPNIPLIAKSNAGIPKWINQVLTYDGTPEVMAAHVRKVRALGASLVGGCCGNNPEHIRAMAAALTMPALDLTEFEISPGAENKPEDVSKSSRIRERKFRG